jgi:hypothetical protein
LIDAARFVGYVGKGSYSGTVGFGVTSGDLIGKTLNVTVNLVDNVVSENGNTQEHYTITFTK